MRSWEVKAGDNIILPEGTEFMRGGGGSEVWYNPHMNRSYYITGSPALGWQITEYDQPLCPKCWERYAEYQEGRIKL